MNVHEINVTHSIHARSLNIVYKGLVHKLYLLMNNNNSLFNNGGSWTFTWKPLGQMQVLLLELHIPFA